MGDPSQGEDAGSQLNEGHVRQIHNFHVDKLSDLNDKECIIILITTIESKYI